MNQELFIGLMSGTSMDGLDGIVVAMNRGRPAATLSKAQLPWPASCVAHLHELCEPGDNELVKMSQASLEIAHHEAQLVKLLLADAGLHAAQIMAIGTHGQTVRHCPQLSFSVQLGSGPQLAALTGIDTIYDFRSADLACGGQGAPLTPLFHQLMLASRGRWRFVLNLGGIANLTVLDDRAQIVAGYDCGPANTLLDTACRELCGEPYDQDASRASQGQIDIRLLDTLWSRYQDFFSRPWPKSTGREYFSRDSIAPELQRCRAGHYATSDLLATLTALTAKSCAQEIRSFADHISAPCELILCGGGAHNPYLRTLLNTYLADAHLVCQDSIDFGIDADYLEAQAFAYFAYRFVHALSVKLATITGGTDDIVLGCLAPARGGYYLRTRS